MGLWNHYDFTKTETVEKAMADIDAHRPLHVHGSPSYTPFTIVQNVNQRTEEQCARLAKQRRWGKKVILNRLEVLRYALGKGCQVSFEHPDLAKDDLVDLLAYAHQSIHNRTRTSRP